MENPIDSKLKVWTGSDIGDIDKYVISHFEDNIYFVKLNNNNIIKVKLVKYKNNIPFIIEELKPYFGIDIFYHYKCKYKNINYIMYYLEKDMTLPEYQIYALKENKTFSKFFIDTLRELFIFKYLLCVKNNREDNIIVRYMKNLEPYTINCRAEAIYPTFLCTNNFILDENDLSGQIPTKVIREWFNPSGNFKEIENKFASDIFDKEIKAFVSKINLIEFDTKIREIFKKYNQDPAWINSIKNRIMLHL